MTFEEVAIMTIWYMIGLISGWCITQCYWLLKMEKQNNATIKK